MIPTPISYSYQDYLLYTSSGKLFLTNLAGDSVIKLPGSGKSIWFPTVSPDFTWIAFWSNDSGWYELWIYDIRKKIRRQLTFFNETFPHADMQNFNVHNAPAWSPDSQRILFSRWDKLWMIDIYGFNLETFTETSIRFAPSWSPDGNFLAYVYEENQTQNLYLRQMSTGQEWPLTHFPSTYRVGSPVWSPAGNQIAFSLSTLEAVDIWLIQKDGSSLKRLTHDGFSNSPAWSPDQQKIAFASGRQDPYHWEIWVMNADGTGQFSVTRHGGFSPAWLREAEAIMLIGPSTTSLFPSWSATKSQPYVQATVSAVSTSPAKAHLVPPPATPAFSRLGQLPAKTALTSGPTPVRTKPPEKQITPLLAKPLVSSSPISPSLSKEFWASKKAKPVEPVKPLVKVPRPTPTQLVKAGQAVSETETDEEDEEDYEEFEEYADEDKTILPSEQELTQAVQGNQIVFTPIIDFYFAKDLIKASSLGTLKQLAENLNQYPDAPLVVQGKIRGPQWLRKIVPILKSLSRARANSVLRHLIVNEKIRQINVTAIGEGDPFPELGKKSAEKPILVVVIK